LVYRRRTTNAFYTYGITTRVSKQVIKVLEKQIRLRIAEDITNWKPLENRAQIIKVAGSLDAALVGVQAICADIAMGNDNDGRE
jgi:hypothetical protein